VRRSEGGIWQCAQSYAGLPSQSSARAQVESSAAKVSGRPSMYRDFDLAPFLALRVVVPPVVEGTLAFGRVLDGTYKIVRLVGVGAKLQRSSPFDPKGSCLHLANSPMLDWMEPPSGWALGRLEFLQLFGLISWLERDNREPAQPVRV